jgi:hypothetical protein
MKDILNQEDQLNDDSALIPHPETILILERLCDNETTQQTSLLRT